MTRFRFRWVVLPIFLLGFALLLLQNRSTQGQASDSWRQLSLSEFVQEMDRLTTAAQEPSAEVWAAIKRGGSGRLRAATPRPARAMNSYCSSRALRARKRTDTFDHMIG